MTDPRVPRPSEVDPFDLYEQLAPRASAPDLPPAMRVFITLS
jgi:hypothetical protein